MADIIPARIIRHVLVIGAIHDGEWIGAEAEVPHVADHSYDFPRTALLRVHVQLARQNRGLHHLADRILIGEEPPGHGLINVHHPWRTFRVPVRHVTSLHQRDLESAEETAADFAKTRAW